jgi:myosin heavy subunit
VPFLTLLHDNSAGFGKYFAIQFNARAECLAAGRSRSNYPLEKSREVFQNKGERNFHIYSYRQKILVSALSARDEHTLPARACILHQACVQARHTV